MISNGRVAWITFVIIITFGLLMAELKIMDYFCNALHNNYYF